MAGGALLSIDRPPVNNAKYWQVQWNEPDAN